MLKSILPWRWKLVVLQISSGNVLVVLMPFLACRTVWLLGLITQREPEKYGFPTLTIICFQPFQLAQLAPNLKLKRNLEVSNLFYKVKILKLQF